ncbi:alanine--tRNA ligase [Gemmatimonadota bacterium]
MRSSKQIRREYIEFFKDRGHVFVPSLPVVPCGDPTLLFVNAGMNQFKDVFLGTGTRDYTRAVNSQKCIRVSGKHNDLEEVGRDTYHHTFFEMLGNWSFGDYGKVESIVWAWELMTGLWKLPKDRLYATVHLDDDEAEMLWQKETDIGSDRVFRFDKDNFWEMGEVGPCGPCSEIHFDLYPGPGGSSPAEAGDPATGVNSGCDRFIELWNLVFIRFERLGDGTLEDLKQMHVDTGMGFERISAVLQGKNSNYETDLFMPLIEVISELSGVDYRQDEAGMAHRVIADHVRMLSFSLADGAICSNEGRGYVVRRILRRAARFGRELGLRNPFIYRLVSTVADLLGEAYPEVVSRSQHISQVIKAEEESFGVTLDRGLELFETVAEKVKAAGSGRVSGEDAFKLYDTYGFPLDLTMLMAREKGLEVDEEQFTRCMENRREESRAGGKFEGADLGANWAKQLSEGTTTSFNVDDDDNIRKQAKLLGADSLSIVLDRTPFYPEGGGQTTDIGTIAGPDFEFKVKDVQRSGSLIVHVGEFTKGSAEQTLDKQEVTAEVDEQRRLATARNHTATHLLHRVLRDLLGESAQQAGSLVSPQGLRFDFNHYERIPEETLLDIEKKVNAQIMADHRVTFTEMDIETALQQGATALFGEKYEDKVRVVEVEGFTKELCGGTHVNATGQIGAFVIVSESSVAAGVRRIEALTGEWAVDHLLRCKHLVEEMERKFSIGGHSLIKRMGELIKENKLLEKDRDKALSEARRVEMIDLINKAEELQGGERVLNLVVEKGNIEVLKGFCDSFREKCKSGTALFGTISGGKALFACAVTDDLVKAGRLKAGELVSRVAKLAGGGGGGKPHLATAGGKQPEKVTEAVAAFPGIVREILAK